MCSSRRPDDIDRGRHRSARTFAPCRIDRATTPFAEQLSIPIAARRQGLDLFHAPHYVLPALTPVQDRRHDSRLHPLDVSGVPEPSSGLCVRASVALHRGAQIRIASSPVSEQSKRDILKFFNVPPEKIVVTPNAIDDRFSAPPSEEHVVNTRERYQLSHSYLLYVGNIKPHKNLERLIEAFHLVRSQGRSELELIIIGDEISKLQSLRRAVHRYDIHRYVRFLGYVPDKTLAVLYRLASVFVFPSLYEGFGLPPLEAMASGTPVVTSNVSSLPEVVGDAAVLVDPYSAESIADGILTVLRSTHLRGELSKRGLERVKAFSWARSVAARARGLRRGAVVSAEASPSFTTGSPACAAARRCSSCCARLTRQPICFTLFHVPGSVSPAIERLRPRTSVLQQLPGMRRFYRYCLPLFPTAIEQFDLDQYDLVISTSHCAAKAVVKTGRARHLCYCFTPMRYAWDQFDAYFGEGRVGTLKSRVLRPVLGALARWDAATAGRVDRYVAISQHVASRIRRYYNRDADVIYPPVDTGFYSPDDTVARENFLLIVSALVPYKRIDVAIEASRLSSMPLRIVGDGPERDALDEARRRDRRRRSAARHRSPTKTFATSIAARPLCCCRAKRISASCPSRHKRAGRRSSRSDAAARSKPSSTASPACSSTIRRLTPSQPASRARRQIPFDRGRHRDSTP